ncbi:G-protein coupled receptor Mth2 [Araneus ventricosus]|uniref:G-protein coupled receptor Mth2 n=1 Tax=Araneus ventricosus TaxID=182803 RepID=A0A4Y2PU16_ARAVE|nr:G-protein coupled receptor Mth2 [Araneus ventricosus]
MTNLVQMVILEDTSNDNASVIILNDDWLNKSESPIKCMPITLKLNEYVIYPNRTAFVPSLNKTFEEPFYKLIDDHMSICLPSKFKDPQEKERSMAWTVLFYISAICEGVSMVFLLIHLLVFAVVKDLQNSPGCNLASLCFSLFLSYLSMAIWHGGTLSENKITCTVLGLFIQFSHLATFLWMFVMGFDVFRSIRNATKNLRTSCNAFSIKRYLCNSSICWGISLVFTAASLITDNIKGMDETYQPRLSLLCWLQPKYPYWLFFGGPVFTLIFLNFMLFGITAYILFANRMKIGVDDSWTQQKTKFLLYLRLTLILGVPWIIEVLAFFLDDKVWLWYVTYILTSNHGIFIFVAFTCRPKTMKQFKSRLLRIHS